MIVAEGRKQTCGLMGSAAMQSFFSFWLIKFIIKLLDKYSIACYNRPINNKHL